MVTLLPPLIHRRSRAKLGEPAFRVGCLDSFRTVSRAGVAVSSSLAGFREQVKVAFSRTVQDCFSFFQDYFSARFFVPEKSRPWSSTLSVDQAPTRNANASLRVGKSDVPYVYTSVHVRALSAIPLNKKEKEALDLNLF